MSSTDAMKHRAIQLLGLPLNSGSHLRKAEETPTQANNPLNGFGEHKAPPAEGHVGVRSPTKSDFSIGIRIRQLRRARVITQRDLAAMVGVTGAQLHRYEMGTTRVAASRLIAIAEALGVHADELMGSVPSADSSPMRAVLADGDDDIVELILVFSSIAEKRNRSALIAVARLLAAKTAPSREDPPAE